MNEQVHRPVRGVKGLTGGKWVLLGGTTGNLGPMEVGLVSQGAPHLTGSLGGKGPQNDADTNHQRFLVHPLHPNVEQDSLSHSAVVNPRGPGVAGSLCLSTGFSLETKYLDHRWSKADRSQMTRSQWHRLLPRGFPLPKHMEQDTGA